MKDEVFSHGGAPMPSIPGYQLINCLGEGGVGRVYEAIKTNTRQHVAIKMLRPDPAQGPQRKRYQTIRFEREMKLCAELDHPHIVKLLDRGVCQEGELYAVFEKVAGGTLKHLILEKGGLPPGEVKLIGGQLLEAILHAERKGVVHRDLNPKNIMVIETESKPFAKVLDFGIGTLNREFRSEDFQTLTLTREVMGTPAYSAPEQLRGEPTSIKSDLYAWGLILLECLTGEQVFQGGSIAEIFQLQLNPNPVSLPGVLVDHPLGNLLRKVLEKNPAKRIPSVAQLYEEFNQINFDSLVGKILPGNVLFKDEDVTRANPLHWKGSQSEKRQITVLCAQFELSAGSGPDQDLELLDTIQRDQMNLGKDMGLRFGAHIAGSLGNVVCFIFGYPRVSDNDARRAGRTALELLSGVRNRSRELLDQHGIRLQVRLGLHAGQVLSKPNQTPEGKVLNEALRLLFQTPPGAILSTGTTQRLLEPYLEFEVFENGAEQVPLEKTYRILGERQTEAFSFLRPFSTDRKMVGRWKELEFVLDRWRDCATEGGQAVLLQGQAGIGKSRMVYEVKRELRSHGKPYREARCLPEHQNNALFPFLSLIRHHWGLNDQLTPEEVLERLQNGLGKAGCELEVDLPLFCFWSSIPLGEGFTLPTAPFVEQKLHFFALLKKVLLSLAGSGPLNLLVEDLHWMDPTGIEFMAYLLNDLENQSLFLLMTARPEFESPWQQTRMHPISLKPLNAKDTETLIQFMLKGRRVEHPVLAYISTRTDGIPLYVEELSRMLLDQDYLFEEDGIYKLGNTLDLEDVPSTLQGLLNARLDRLGFAKETAQIASAIGREFDFELLRLASNRDGSAVLIDLHRLMGENIVVRQRSVERDRYVFRHALLRDAAYEGMLGTAKQENHARIAEALEGHFPKSVAEQPFEMARHLSGAESYARAVDYGVKTIEQQMGKSLLKEAEATAALVPRWAQKIKDPILRVKKEIALNVSTSAIAYQVDGPGSVEHFAIIERSKSLFEVLRAHPDHIEDRQLVESELRNAWAIFMYYAGQGKFAKAIETGEEIVEQAQQIGHLKVEMAVSSYMVQALCQHCEFERAKLFARKVIDQCDPVLDKEIAQEFGVEPFIVAAGMMAYIMADEGDIEGAESLLERAMERAKQTESLANMVWGNSFLYLHLALLGERDRVRTLVQAFRIEAGEGLNEIFISCVFDIIWDWAHGESETALARRKFLLETGHEGVVAYYEILIAETMVKSGRVEEAVVLLQESIARQESSSNLCKLAQSYDLLSWAFYHLYGTLCPKTEQAFDKALSLAQAFDQLLPEYLAKRRRYQIMLKEERWDDAHRLMMDLKHLSGQGRGILALDSHRAYIANTAKPIKAR